MDRLLSFFLGLEAVVTSPLFIRLNFGTLLAALLVNAALARWRRWHSRGPAPVYDGPPAEAELVDADNPSECGGTTADYTWTQSAESVDVWLPLPPGAQRAAIAVRFSRTAVEASVDCVERLAGATCRPIDPDECTWQIDDDKAGGRTLWITLQKVTPTHKREHWACVLTGHEEIDVSKFGPTMCVTSLLVALVALLHLTRRPISHTINPDDPNSIRKAVEGSRTAAAAGAAGRRGR